MTLGARSPLAVDGSVVIVGAGLGGLRCAETLRIHGFAGDITLVGDEEGLPYDRPPLTKQLLAGEWDEDRIALATSARLSELGISLRAGVPAASLDAMGRSVTLADGTVLRGDAVVVATGATPRWIPGTEGAEGIHVVRTLPQAQALRDELAGLGDGGRVVVVGAGFIGAEVASTAASGGRLSVSVVEGQPIPLANIVGEMVGAWLTELHEEAGIDVRAGRHILTVEAAQGASGPAVVLDTGERLEADTVVVGIGVEPSTAWLEGSGLEVRNGVVADASLFAADGVLAIGDVARFEWHHAGVVEEVRIEHWEVAAQQAAHAAHAMLAGRDDAAPLSIVPYFWSDQHGRKIQMLGRPDASKDEAVHATGSLAERRFCVLYHRAGRLTGVLGLSSPRQVMLCRGLVDRGAPLHEGLAALD